MVEVEELESKQSETVHNNETKDKYQIYSSLAFMIVVILIGVPMWWKTTEVYRVSLPDFAIKELDSTNINISLSIYLYSSKSDRITKLTTELRSYFQSNNIFNINFVPVTNVNNNVKTPAGLENLIRKNVVVKLGDFLLIEWATQTEDIIVTSERTAFISENVTAKKLETLLKLNILKIHEIRRILNEEKSHRLRGSTTQKQHDVIISVLNPRPDIMDVKWNVREASQLYLQPFLDYINPISNYSLKTQWKYQVPFEFPLKQIRDHSKLGRHYGLSEQDLPHIITAVEKNLGSVTSDNSIINLIVYIPPCEIAPLYIYGQNEQPNPTVRNNTVESFASPKWGAVIIYNPPTEICLKYNVHREKVYFKINSKEAMQSLLFHLQKFYELNTEIQLDGVKVMEIDSLNPREWEYDAYIRRTVVTQIITTIRTLQSLIQLLDNISYIVINDDVGGSINKAYDNIVKAREYLANGLLTEAMIYAREGYISSENAFFDASLLAQLYFPDEQKYAIYIPLFLPIMVPVVTSLAMMTKWYGRKDKNEKIKTS